MIFEKKELLINSQRFFNNIFSMSIKFNPNYYIKKKKMIFNDYQDNEILNHINNILDNENKEKSEILTHILLYIFQTKIKMDNDLIQISQYLKIIIKAFEKNDEKIIYYLK